MSSAPPAPATRQRERQRARRRRNERVLGLGLAIGAAGLAIGSRYLARRAHRAAGEGLVDWPRAEQIAVSRLRRAPGALPREELLAAQAAYEAEMRRIVPLLEEQLGLPLPGVVERHSVVDRAGWARANLATFEQLIERLEPHLPANTREDSLASGVARLANRILTTQQVGFLLGFLGTRVLGQYDIALLSAEARPGRLLFVEENIRGVAGSLGVPLDQFRTWIALHETTHAFEFEANSWLRPYLAERLERQLAGLLDEARSLQAGGILPLLRRLSDAGGNPLRGLLSAEGRRLFDETQLVMSLLEGFSDWVMDEVGAQLLPDVASIRTRFEARRDQRRRGLERIVARLTGLDLKLEQYRRGERFVAGAVAAGGREAIKLLWAGPLNLPSQSEMDDPAAWVRRVAPQALAASA
ncbi:MAG TPA: zinc-dependent metalloprotease [Candidatus Limnocylindria bacterium]|nr:zinc-dependent metalloprotease [Candidatus Limnocylindria bacterium]